MDNRPPWRYERKHSTGVEILSLFAPGMHLLSPTECNCQAKSEATNHAAIESELP